MSRLLAATARALAIGLLVVLMVLVLLSGGLWWWSGTEGSLAWALERVGRWQPVVAEGVSGSLRSGLRIQRLVWERDGLKVEAGDLAVQWSPQFLLAGELRLPRLSAASVKVTDRRPPTGQPPRPPASLDPGLRLTLDKVTIGRLQWDGATKLEASGLAGDYLFSGGGHQLRISALTVGSGQYSGRAAVGSQAPMKVDAQLQGTVTTSVPGSTASLPLAFSASASGPLEKLVAQARVGLVAATATQPSPAPGATVTAVVTPWAPQPLPQAQARLQAIDLHAFWAQAPQTQLSGDLQVQPAGSATWALQADLRNAIPGPWDSGRLPLDQLKAQGQWRGGVALVRSLQAGMGGGSVQAEGRWSGDGWTADGSIRNVNPAALHSKLAASSLGGKLQLRQQGKGIAFDAALTADGPARPAKLAAGVAPLDLRELTAQGNWSEGVLELPALRLRTSDALLQGALTARPAARSGSGKLQLQAPGLQARADGEIAETRGHGTLNLQAGNLALAQRWLQGLPFVPAALGAWRAGGQATLDGKWQGGWKDPAVQGALTSPLLTLQASSAAAGSPTWTLRETRVVVDGRLADAALVLQAKAQQGQRRLALDAAGRGGRSGGAWRAKLATLKLSVQDPAIGPGQWRADAQGGVDALWRAGRLEVAAGQAVLTAPGPAAGTALLAWDPVRWGGGELQTAGRLTGLPMAWVELAGGPQLAGSALTGNLVFDARWNAQLGAGMRLDASLARSSGDITVQVENAEGATTRVAAGVRTATLTLQGRDGAMTLGLEWDSERAGTAHATAQTRLVRGGPAGWLWPQDAQLAGKLQAQLPRLAVWSLLAPPGWRLRGALVADLSVSGSRTDPQFAGSLRADELALRSVVDGVELRNGSLKARLQGQQLVVEEFVLHGAGQGGAGGSLVASGEGRWEDGAPQLQASVELNKLRASIRSDRELTVSGKLAATLTPKGGTIRGKLSVDQARIVIPDETPPKLGQDVVVRNSPGVAPTSEQRKQKKPDTGPPRRPLDVAVQVDLGSDFRLSGRGIDTRLAGTLALSGVSLTAPRLEGTIRAVDGEYRAYGQRLEIERGVLRFTGPLDNPALDILAVRPRLDQKVGVLVTGSAQAPFVRLYSEPQLADAEALSWLVTGKPAASGGAESALLQQAALALLNSRRGGTNSGGIAGKFGLDELSVHRDDTAGAVVTLGKRFARDFYASYESSLGGALGTLNIFYDISRRLTLRARAGERTAVDLIYTFAFD
ncbi:translocation/assembly module TamB domain-containing protein [Caenimonas terrae]|uniref:Translocation/assembly module TamB domain-containing protein n=1 Tax=Caenimonas terrae TaxID=696074 RepID=A0ABW0NDL8_9BURK